jgi:hypothetical protein
MVQAHWCQPKCFHAMADHLSVLERERSAIAAVMAPPGIPLVVISSGDLPADYVAAQKRLAEAAGGRHVQAARSAHWIQFDEPELIVSEVRQLVQSARE